MLANVPTAPDIAQVDISSIASFNLFLFLLNFAQTVRLTNNGATSKYPSLDSRVNNSSLNNNFPADINGSNRIGQRAIEYIEKGFTAVKFDPVGIYSPLDPRQLSLEELIKVENFVKTIHNSVKNKCDLLIGTHGQMTSASAIRLAKRLEKFDPMWFEEPVPPENFEAARLLGASAQI